MSVYTVQAPNDAFGEPDVEKAIFLREGFSWPAFFFGIFWLAAQGLWLSTALWLVMCCVFAWLAIWHFDFGTSFWIFLALRILLGLEANGLRRRKLAGRRYRLVDIVSADALESAERVFFNRWPHARARSPESGLAPAPVPSEETDVLGLFPRPEDRG